MKKITRCFILLLSLCLYLSGCKNAPTNGKDEQSSSHTPMPPEQFWADYATSSDAGIQIIGDKTHITREITAKCIAEPSETRTIKFDLDIPETPQLTAFNYANPKGGQFDIIKIMRVFFGERADDFVIFEESAGEVYHNSTDIYDNSLALYEKENGKLYLVNGDAAAMDFTSNNMLKSADEMQITLTEEEAIALCDKFLNDCGVTGYKYDYTYYYGATQSTFYSIRYYYELDSLPTSSPTSDGKGFGNITFLVDDHGIEKIKGNLFDNDSFNREQNINPTQIISSAEAIGFVEKHAALIRCGNETPKFDKYFSERGEGLLYLPIREMKLGYWFSEKNGINLAWIFFIGEDDAIEKSASFAIDAISGKVYNY